MIHQTPVFSTEVKMSESNREGINKTAFSPRQELDNIRRAAEGDQAEVDRFRRLLRDDSGGVYLRGISLGTPLAAAPMESIKEYIHEFVSDAIGCDPSNDPLLRTLAEQVILAHHTVGRLQCEALESKDAEERRVNLQLAISLTGELRRLTKELVERIEGMGRRNLRVAELADADLKKEGGRKRTA